MAYFSISLVEESFNYFSEHMKPNQKYFSKDISLWKYLNNKNKDKPLCLLQREVRLKTLSIGKKLLICLPPKFGLGDAIEYSIAIKSLIESKKFERVGVAYCSNHTNIFRDLFLFSNIYPTIISEEQTMEYDTIFHVTLEIKALKFQKYLRSNIAKEISKYFNIKTINIKFKNNQIKKKKKKIISVFPISTSVIRSLPGKIIQFIIENFKYDYKIKIILDDSFFSKNLLNYICEDIKKNNCEIIKPKNIEELIEEISNVYFGIFVDSGPLHLAKLYDKYGILVETSVSGNILLDNSNKIYSFKNDYVSNFCSGPCGLVDIFSYNKTVGCYETNKVSFNEIRNLENLKKLNRFNKFEKNTYFVANPVGCIKKINVNNLFKLIKAKLKETQCEDL